MDSRIAIAHSIADLDCDASIKESLSALFNLELMANPAEPVTKISYVKELEARSQSWTSSQNAEESK
jgi:hypothetical protein